MTLDELAERLFDAACFAQSERMLTKNERERGEKPNPRKVACQFKELMDVPKAHYRAMAQFVLDNFNTSRDELAESLELEDKVKSELGVKHVTFG